MSSSSVTHIEGHDLRVTNLDKVVYPATGTTKAEIIAYYVAIADHLLPHIEGRIVTRKRWVHGVGTLEEPGEVFFEKNLPQSAPEWIRRVEIQHRDHVNVYPIFENAAGLAWAAQVAALELHVPQWRVGSDQHPDRLVLDLDPGPGTNLSHCVAVAHHARSLLSEIGLAAFPVTSGSKGIHLYASLDGSLDAERVNNFAHEFANALAEELPELVVTSMRKKDRHERVLLDWSQNNANKTTIAPYSLRGRLEPYVAVPRTWDELDDPSLRHLLLHEVLERMENHHDPMSELGRGEDHLARYRSMRDQRRTPEPVPEGPVRGSTPGTTFVIQEHHARQKHWDFRLERDGVLKSWALPKGVPAKPQKNHLAVQTEDHPLEYGSFEGTIPHGEYGAGHVTIWDHGTYETEKWRDDEIIVTLTGHGPLREPTRYALIRTEENWLIHLMKNQARPTAASFIEPMLATAGEIDDITRPDEWAFEMKWDGVRVIAALDDGTVTLFSRTGRNVSDTYPEVTAALTPLASHTSAVLDGEVVAMGSDRVPSFSLLQRRISLTQAANVTQAAKDVPVEYIAFDIVHSSGRPVVRKPYRERRALLEALELETEPGLHLAEDIQGYLPEALAASRQRGFEGLVAKRLDSRYRPGYRSTSWIKLKHARMQAVLLGGWRPGQGSRQTTFGSLLLGVQHPDGIRYVGRVGTGFDQVTLELLSERLRELQRDDSPFFDVPRDVAAEAVWVEPVLIGEVEFNEWTKSGRLRHPTWRGLREDLEPKNVHPE